MTIVTHTQIFATICKKIYTAICVTQENDMKKQKALYEDAIKYSFYFETDLHPEMVRWRYKDEAVHAAFCHRTYKPKLSDLVIETKLPKDLKLQIRRELLESMQEEES
jgi:hypothetical protein